MNWNYDNNQLANEFLTIPEWAKCEQLTKSESLSTIWKLDKDTHTECDTIFRTRLYLESHFEKLSGFEKLRHRIAGVLFNLAGKIEPGLN